MDVIMQIEHTVRRCIDRLYSGPQSSNLITVQSSLWDALIFDRPLIQREPSSHYIDVLAFGV